MEINKKGVILRRLKELMLSCFILSLVASVLNLMNIIDTVHGLMILLGLFSLFFWLVNIRQMRDCYADLKGDKVHFRLNIIAYLLFIGVNGIFYLVIAITNEELARYVYTFIFALTKVFKYVPPYINSNFLSAVVFHAVGIAAVFIAPTGISFEISYKEQNDKKSEV
ncbi:MAG: hypothetical protein IJ300_11900 [Clostridia bacterium]|nr:hypothetical protein [Clostridia bacterium]